MKLKLAKTKEQIKFEYKLRKVLIDKKVRNRLTDTQLANKLNVSEIRLKRLIYNNTDSKLNSLIRLISGLGLKLTIL